MKTTAKPFTACPLCGGAEVIRHDHELHEVGVIYEDGEPSQHVIDDSPTWLKTEGFYCMAHDCEYSYRPGRAGLPITDNGDQRLVWDR